MHVVVYTILIIVGVVKDIKCGAHQVSCTKQYALGICEQFSNFVRS